MAEVKRVPQWLMLEALRYAVTGMHLEKSDGTSTGFIQLLGQQFDIDTSATEPVLKMLGEQTLEVGEGETIVAIVLWIDDTESPAIYDADDDREIRYPIVDVDGNGEYFPDGGSIDTTEFEVYLNDL